MLSLPMVYGLSSLKPLTEKVSPLVPLTRR